MDRPEATLSRRGLITAAAGAGAVLAGAHLARRNDALPASAPPAASEAPAAKGYRLTEHVRRYYQTTRI
jgi:hypothetical protein